jgi:hypothetical protein
VPRVGATLPATGSPLSPLRAPALSVCPSTANQPFAERHGERLGYWVAAAPRCAGLWCAASYVTAGTGTSCVARAVQAKQDEPVPIPGAVFVGGAPLLAIRGHLFCVARRAKQNPRTGRFWPLDPDPSICYHPTEPSEAGSACDFIGYQ